MTRDEKKTWSGFDSGKWYGKETKGASEEKVPRRKPMPSKDALIKALGIGNDGRSIVPAGGNPLNSVLPSTLQRQREREPRRLASLWLFGGSGLGNDPSLWGEAVQLAEILAKRKITLIYNGASEGMLGMVAEQFLRMGGQAIVVTTKASSKTPSKQVHTMVVERSSERRELMLRKPDCYCALPGGVGTFRDILEVWLWGQMGLHKKPTGLLNAAGFYDGFVNLTNRMVAEGFLSESRRGKLLLASTGAELMDTLEDFCPISSGHDDNASVQHSIG